MTDLRCVNQPMRTLVDNLPSYDKIIKHCPDALRALRSTHMAARFTAGDIVCPLLTKECFLCGESGPFLDLLTAKRACITCTISSETLLSVTASSAKKKKYGLSSAVMRILPVLTSVPGSYTESESHIGGGCKWYA